MDSREVLCTRSHPSHEPEKPNHTRGTRSCSTQPSAVAGKFLATVVSAGSCFYTLLGKDSSSRVSIHRDIHQKRAVL
ncbi:Hypothetical predicted protein [Olea europaea subsp. europaea]|uniref:Uncharacterized protein n=1 Tax=Olea europaea subsp. europaea TaxID=158383 RepID=A0A8S0QFF2_OLEEU|nr:Hypothetical predicted protein [Olea europaea subsp. europaea]